MEAFMKQEIISYLNTIKDEIYNITKFLYDNPEESYKERKAAAYLTKILRDNNFKVIDNFLDISTAFYGEYGKDYPKICFLCDLDAPPSKGHIHGHNLSTAISCSAALALSRVVDKTGGTVIILGCPGEYIGGAKVTMAKQGIFDDIDVAMMVHPDILTAEGASSKAVLPLSIKFSKASGSLCLKSDCLSSMDASLFILNSLNILIKGYGDNLQIDLVLSDSRKEPSLPKDISEIKLYIRAKDFTIAEEVEGKIKRLVETASFITNVSSEVNIYELPYSEMITNKTLTRIFSHNLKELGIIDSYGLNDIEQGLSMGNVSHCTASIHPYIQITEKDDIPYGTEKFSVATLSDFAQERALHAASALALTGLDIIEKENLISEIKEEFYAKVNK